MMTTKRRKADKMPLPQTTEAAIALLAEYAALDAEIAQIRAETDAMIARLRAGDDELLAPMEARIKALFNQIKPWWAIAGEDLTGGKRKSIELGGCVLGHRTTPPKLDCGKMTEKAAVDALIAADLGEFVRVKYELDKPKLLAGVAFQPIIDTPIDAAIGQQLRNLGFAAKQKDEFFIDRIPPKDERVEQVEGADDAVIHVNASSRPSPATAAAIEGIAQAARKAVRS